MNGTRSGGIKRQMVTKKFTLDDKSLEAYNSEKKFMEGLNDLIETHKETLDKSRMAVTLLDVAHDILLTEKGPYQSLIIATGILHGFSQRGLFFDPEKLH